MRCAWGDTLVVDGKAMANTWTGDFPHRITTADDFKGTAPVGSFPVNGYDIHNMAGIRPALRQATPPDTGMSHIGFRRAKSVAPPLKPAP